MKERAISRTHALLAEFNSITYNVNEGNFVFSLKQSGRGGMGITTAAAEYNADDRSKIYIKMHGRERPSQAEYERIRLVHNAAPEYTVGAIGEILDGTRLLGIVMERLPSGTLTLEEFTRRNIKSKILDLVAKQLDDFVATLEAKGVVHGDLVAWNVFVDRNGRLIVLDPLPVIPPEYTDRDRRTLSDLKGFLRVAREEGKILEVKKPNPAAYFD